MHRLCLVLILILAVAGACFAQTSSGSSSGTTAAPSAPPAGSAAPATGAGATPNATTNQAPATSGQQTPIAPGTTTTANPGDPTAPSGGAPLVPGSAVPTTDSNNATTNTNATGATTSSPTGAVAPSIRLETQMPPAGASSTVTGVPAGVTSSGRAGQTSAPTTYTVPVLNSPRNDVNPDPNAAAGATTPDMGGMTYAGSSYAGEGVDNRSLAEIAAQYKRNRATQNARVFTNEDVARLNARSDTNVMGAEENAALPQGDSAAAPPQPQTQQKPHKRSPFSPKLPK